MSPTNSSLRSAEPTDGRSLGERSLGSDLDNIFRLSVAPGQERLRPSAPTAAAEPRRMTQTDLDAALDMLNRAARAMDVLQARYQQVESYAKDLAERAERDLAAAYSQARDWEGRAAASETKFDEARARLSEADRRAELAERRAEHAEHRAEHAERSATETREWLECFYDKIVASFDTRPLLKPAAA